MADLTITAASVVAGSNASKDTGTSGATIIAGKTVYKDPTTNKWLLADSNSATAAAKTAGGIALNGASNNQPIAVQKGGDIDFGAAILTPGSRYYLSETPGGIQPEADLGSGENVCLLGIAKTTSVLSLSIQAPGVTL